MTACVHGRLAECTLHCSAGSAVTVVMASSGYPEAYETGKVVSGLPSGELGEDEALVFHAGTRLSRADGCGGEIVTDGGRVLSVTAKGATLAEAAASAYRTVESISFDGAVWREDIGRDVA